MLYIKVVRCPHPHARVIGINKEKALAIEGVVAVLTATDIPGYPVNQKKGQSWCLKLPGMRETE